MIDFRAFLFCFLMRMMGDIALLVGGVQMLTSWNKEEASEAISNSLDIGIHSSEFLAHVKLSRCFRECSV
jgi:hypothetical protein